MHIRVSDASIAVKAISCLVSTAEELHFRLHAVTALASTDMLDVPWHDLVQNEEKQGEEKKEAPASVPAPEPPPAAAPKEEAPAPAPKADPPAAAPSVPDEPKEPPADPELAAKVEAALLPLKTPECALLTEDDQSGWDLNPILQWISDKDKKSRLCWLTRHRGDFASSLSAALVKHAASPGAAFHLLHHFVRHNNVRTKDPILAVRTLASQLFHSFPVTLSGAYTDPMNVPELDAAIEALLLKPLSKVKTAKPTVVLIDGLDEALHGLASDTTRKCLGNRILRVVQGLTAKLKAPAMVLVTSVSPESGPAYLSDGMSPLEPTRLTISNCRLKPSGTAAKLGVAEGDEEIDSLYSRYLEANVGGGVEELLPVLGPVLAAREPLTVEQLEQCGAVDPGAVVGRLGVLFHLTESGVVEELDRTLCDFLRTKGPWFVDEGAAHTALNGIIQKELTAASANADEKLSGYSLRNGVFHASKVGPEAIDAVAGNVTYWQQCFAAKELQALDDLLRLQDGRSSATVNDAVRLLSFHKAEFLQDPGLVPLRAYDSPRDSVFASSLRAGDGSKPPPGWLVSKPMRWQAELHYLKAHKKGINSVAVSTDAKLVASGSDDTNAALWDAATGEKLFSLDTHKDEVTAVAFSPDGSTLATASWDNLILLWSVSCGKVRATLKGHTSGVTCLAFREDGGALMSGSDDNSVRLWDPKTGELLKKLDGHAMAVTCVALRPDGDLLASGSEDSTISVWDSESAEELQCLEGHAAAVNAVAFCLDSNLLASGSWDRTVRLWKPSTGEAGLVIQDNTAAVNGLAFFRQSPGGPSVLAVASGKSISVRDPTSGSEIKHLVGKQNDISALVVAASSETGTSMVCGSRDGSIQIWDSSLESSSATIHTDSVAAVACSTDGAVVASASWDNSTMLWDASTGELKTKLTGHTNGVTCLGILDGGVIVTGSDDQSIRMWDATTGSMTAQLASKDMGLEGVTSLAVVGEGLVASGEVDGAIRLWDTASGGSEVARMVEHLGPVTNLAMARSATTLASGSSDATLRLWDTAERSHKLCVQCEGPVIALAIAPSAEVVAVALESGNIVTWDGTSGEQKLNFAGGCETVGALAFSPDGTLLASGGSDATVRLWDAATGTEKSAWKVHLGSVSSLTFSPDGATLYSGSDDNTVRVWSVPV